MAVVVVVVLVALVEPALVLALQLVVEDDALDVRAAVQETVLGLFVGAIDLKVVLEFPFAHQARVERLRVLVIVSRWLSRRLRPSLVRPTAWSRYPGTRVVSIKPLFAQVSQVARAWIGRAPIVVSEITTGDHSECANGRQRARLGAAQGVFAIAVANALALWSARQVDVTGERIRDLAIALSIVAISVGPAGIVSRSRPCPSDPCRSFPGPRPSDRASSSSRSRGGRSWLQSSLRSRSLEPPRPGVGEWRSSSRES